MTLKNCEIISELLLVNVR